MRLECDLTRVDRVLEPRKAIPMRLQTRDNVSSTIPVHIGGVNLRAAISQRIGMPDPDGIAAGRAWLAPPAVLVDDVISSVAIDIANAQPMREALIPRVAVGNGMKSPVLNRL